MDTIPALAIPAFILVALLVGVPMAGSLIASWRHDRTNHPDDDPKEPPR